MSLEHNETGLCAADDEEQNNTLLKVLKHNFDFHSSDDAQAVKEPEGTALRKKIEKSLDPILRELIKTEEIYVENLRVGLANYGPLFQRQDLPAGLRGMKCELFGNIEAVYEFHRDIFLPMLQRHQEDLKRLFEEFQHMIDTHLFYGYVIFTMNKQKSLKLCDIHHDYFRSLQNELEDKLGISSFLLQPIQRIGRYPLLLKQFIEALFKTGGSNAKSLLESCCRLDKKLLTLLATTNESEMINDIIHCKEFNIFCQGKFRKASAFQVYDYTQRRMYTSKVFIFDKCIVYTEIKGKTFVFRGHYPIEVVGFSPKPKYVTLFYEHRSQQKCDFHADPSQIVEWVEVMRDVIGAYMSEKRPRPATMPDIPISNPIEIRHSEGDLGTFEVRLRRKRDEEDNKRSRTTWYT